jgi:hypothetical protein
MWKITHVTPVEKDLATGKDWEKSGVGSPDADAGYWPSRWPAEDGGARRLARPDRKSVV